MDQGIIYHKDLFASGRWAQMSFFTQMGNIGSEVNRACRWRDKPERMRPAFERALELLDFTIALSHGPRLRELLRAREVLCDFFAGDNDYHSTPEQMKKYFDAFGLASNSQKVREADR